MKSGDVFLINTGSSHRSDKQNLDESHWSDVRHLFVVISAPEKLPDVSFKDYVFLTMLTTQEKWKDNSCIITPDDYSVLAHNSVAAFDVPPSLWVTLGDLQMLKNKKRLVEKEPIPSNILERLRKGYAISHYRKDKIFQFLFRQGVVD